MQKKVRSYFGNSELSAAYCYELLMNKQTCSCYFFAKKCLFLWILSIGAIKVLTRFMTFVDTCGTVDIFAALLTFL